MLGRVNNVSRLLAFCALVLGVSGAYGNVSGFIIDITASNSSGTDSFSVPLGDLVSDPDGGHWALPLGGHVLSTPGNVIATLNAATLRYVDNPLNIPRILMSFEIVAGNLNTTIGVKSPLVSFPTLPASSSQGRATAGFTLSDYSDGVPASLEGLSGFGMFTADYNGFVPGGTQFANLVPGPLTATDGGTAVANGVLPPVGTWQTIGVGVNDISLMEAFTLTGKDLMSTTNSFLVMPEPTALALLALGALALRRR
jgi:hypothetical protein